MYCGKYNNLIMPAVNVLFVDVHLIKNRNYKEIRIGNCSDTDFCEKEQLLYFIKKTLYPYYNIK